MDTCQFCLSPLHKGPCESWESDLGGTRKQQTKVAGKAPSAKSSGTRSTKISPAKKVTPVAAKPQPAHQPAPRPTVKALVEEAGRQQKLGNKATAEKLRKMAYRLREANKQDASKRAYRRREADRKAAREVAAKT